MTNYVRCWHSCRNGFFNFLKRYNNLCLYWRCWNVQTIAAGLFGRKILSDHSLFAVDHHGHLISSLWCSCTEKEWQLPFYMYPGITELYLLLDLVVFWEGVGVSNHLHLIGHVKLVLQWKNSIPSWFHSLVKFKRSLRRRERLGHNNAKAWGSHGRHLECLKPSKTSYFFLNFSVLTWHLANCSKATSSLLLYLSF